MSCFKQQASLQQTIGMHLLLKFEAARQSKDSAIKDLLFEGSQRSLTVTSNWLRRIKFKQ